jgi:xylose dehydrogenase (NAD/NADP)
MTTRWGFLGASWIASTALAPAVHGASNAILQAVASRDPKRAIALESITVHNSYNELLADPQVDAVYISLANHLHSKWSIKALNAGKHVLCEKPFATNSAEARLMADAALANDRLLVEAIWTRWHPRFARMVDLIQSGTIGELGAIDSAFTFPGSLDGNYRLAPEMGGGSLLDVGPYQVHSWVALAGLNADLKISAIERNIGSTGVDLTTKVSGFLNNAVAINAITSFERAEEQRLLITGSLAKIEVIGNEAFTSWNSTSALRIGDSQQEFAPIDPFRVMIEGMGARINDEESWLPSLGDSIRVMELLDQVRLWTILGSNQ